MAANTCNQPPFRGNGTGAQADYVFGFEYINRADVEVYVGEPGNWTQFTEGNAANANEYQWQNATTIRLNAATGTDNVLITRETDRCDPAVEFFAGTSIRAEDLNANQEQTLLLIQEMSATLSENGASQPPGSDGITVGDLEGVNLTDAEDRAWLYFDGTNWVNGDVITSDDDWASSNTQIATTAAINSRITGGDDGTFFSHLVWTGTGNTRTATQFQDTADADPRNIADTEIVRVNGADVLRITFAAGVFTVTARGPANLRWDQKCDQFTVSVQNPTGETNFIDEIISPLTSATRFETDLSEYTSAGVSPDFAAGTTSTQTFNVADGDNLITPGTTADDDLEGGSATATVTFRLVDDTVSTDTAVCNIEWPDAGTNLTTGNPASMRGNTFLERYETCAIVVATQNLATPANASHTLTSSDADDVFEETDGTALTQPFTGNATVQVDWDEPIEWDTATIPTITCTTDYTRPAAVTGTEYTVEDETETLTPTATFTFPSLTQFRDSRNAADAPTQASLIDGTGFETDVTVLGNEAVTFDATVNNDSDVARGFWFCCRASLANQPNNAVVRAGGIDSNVTPVVVEDVALRDDGSLVTAVNYNCYGITLQAGFNARVRFNRT